VWLARLLSELRDAEVQVLVLRVDNKSTISLVKNPVHHDQSKHIDARYHMIQGYKQIGQIVVEFIKTEEQLGDILTKPLSKIKFRDLCNKIGLKTHQKCIKA
jgi:kynurenine formamidase